MKHLILLAIVCTLFSCATEKNALDSWIGKTKHDLIMEAGYPTRIDPDGDGGEVLLWSQDLYNPFTGNKFYKYTMYFVNKNDIVYHWLVQQGAIPPQQLDISLFIR
jgi:hypothetical protein